MLIEDFSHALALQRMFSLNHRMVLILCAFLGGMIIIPTTLQEEVLLKIRHNTYRYSKRHATCWEDLDFVRTAVRMNGRMLKHVPEEMRDSLMLEEDCIMEALLSNGWGLAYCSEAVQNNRHMVIAALMSSGAIIRFASPALQKDIGSHRALMRCAVQRNGMALADADPILCGDRFVVMSAVQQNASALPFAEKALQQDYEVLLLAMVSAYSSNQFWESLVCIPFREQQRLMDIYDVLTSMRYNRIKARSYTRKCIRFREPDMFHAHTMPLEGYDHAAMTQSCETIDEELLPMILRVNPWVAGYRNIHPILQGTQAEESYLRSCVKFWLYHSTPYHGAYVDSYSVPLFGGEQETFEVLCHDIAKEILPVVVLWNPWVLKYCSLSENAPNTATEEHFIRTGVRYWLKMAMEYRV